MNEMTYQKSYQEYKVELDQELQKSAETFVKIGYLLKVARDTNVLAESPYDNVNDFAKAEYGIDKSQVSRFIHINDRFSVDGYSDQLQDQYKGFGHAKLSIMLQLPDAVNEELSPSFSKTEINAIKEEMDKEKKISDIEVMLEHPESEIVEMDSLLQKMMYKILKENKVLFSELHRCNRNHATESEIKEALAPDEERMYTARIDGIGRMILSVKISEPMVSVINMRSGEKEEFEWQEMIGTILQMVNGSIELQDAYEQLFHEKLQDVNETEVEMPAKRKESKVSASKEDKSLLERAKDIEKNHADKNNVEKKNVEKKNDWKEESVEDAKELESEDAIPGQKEISEYPQYLPEGYEQQEEKTEKPAMNPPETSHIDETDETGYDRSHAIKDAEIVLDFLISSKNENVINARDSAKRLLQYLEGIQQ